jgi:hypothetical protein
MSLVEKAKKKAQEVADQKKKEEEAEAKFSENLKTSLAKMTRQVLSGLRELHGVKTKKGTLRLVRKQKKPYNTTVAVLRLIRPKDQESIDLLYVDVAIESGTRDYSDDCRDVPYTESIVKVYVKETNSRSRDSYDWGPYHPNYGVWGLGLKEFFSTYFYSWDDDKFKTKMDEIAEWISPLFSEK